MRSNKELLQDMVNLMKDRLGADLPDIIDAFYGEPTIPVSAFACGLTPLQVAAAFLQAQSYSQREIAQFLSRPKSSVSNALRAAQEKGIRPKEDPSTKIRIPVSAFSEHLSPAEALVYFLHVKQGLANSELARLIGRDPRNTWKLLEQAKAKGGAGREE